MPCNCRDINGSLLDHCLGLCKTTPNINPDVAETVLNRQLSSLDNTIEKLRKMAENLEYYLNQHKFDESYRRGFKDGFELGMETKM